MEELRKTILIEQEILGTKQRFGLFSQPTALAIGDDSAYKKKILRQGEDGKPITLPRNLLAGSNRSGVGKKDFIETPESIYRDPFLETAKQEQKYERQNHRKAGFHEIEFKSSCGLKTLAHSSYSYSSQKPIEKKRPAKDQHGRIICKPQNITTNPQSKVISELFKAPKYISDPINRKNLLEKQQLELSKKKMPEFMFKSMSHGNILFGNAKQTYGIDDKAKQILSNSKSPFRESIPRSVSHETKFKLARRGHGDAIGKYPEFIMPEEEKKIESDKKDGDKEKKEAWRPNADRKVSRPTPSISYSLTNLRRHL